jgi:hypothetical protein
MKYLISILLTLIFTILTVKVEAEETKNDRLTISSNLYLSSVSNNGTRSFDVGESLQTKQEKILADERLRRLATSYQRSQRIYGESAGGYGEAKILYTDYTNDCVTWVKQQKGIPKSQSIGNGARGAINSYEPQIGAIGAERGRVHAVLVVAINGDNITIHESNFYKNVITERVLNRNDFVGFII